jgi:glycosyltransferase involved in cell wall biosynthesis
MQSEKKYSIIISTLNCLQDLKSTIENLKQSSYRNFEVIVIDGNSNDGIKTYLKQENFINKWISEKDNGIYDAWNKGLKLCSGDWIMFLGAGDCIDENLFTKYDKLTTQGKSSIDFIFCKIRIGTRIVDSNWDWKTFRKYMNIPHCGSIMSKLYFNEFGEFNSQFKIAGDYEMLLRKKEKIKAKKLDFEGVLMKKGGISQSNTKVFLESKKAKIIHNTQNRVSAFFYYLYSLFKHKLKKYLMN